MDFLILYYAVQILAGFIAFITIWGMIPLDHWWVRGVEFPRIQLIVLGTLAWVGLLAFWFKWELVQGLLFGVLSLALAFQLRMILPYTQLWKKQVREAADKPDHYELKLMVSNVLTPNNNMQALIKLVKEREPDILITLESDEKWQQALEVIEADYPYTVKVPLDNLYGMHLYSKLELIEPEVKYLMVDDIPSIHTQLRLKSGRVIWLYCLHPMPPSPTEADKSTTRDAELLMVGRHIKEQGQTAILAGDLNDVAWSKTTRRFQRISGLLDPRIGRHFINTFHVKYPFLRWALDHIFHSECFTLVNMERLPSIGSDHFPVLTTLQYEPEVSAEQKQNASTPDAEDLEETKKTIEAGEKEGIKVSKEHREEGAELDAEGHK
ncbi:MAG: endonuclease/exonuclease/phosphatase family protein [Psychrobacter sp.]|nr:endonuclease/exonuclease/phosphatase family protein [Psychrobacter sp.]